MDLFAHRIHSAEYVNGCVRLECSIVRPDEKGEYHPNKPVEPGDTTFSVNLPLQGFMRSMGAMRELMQKLQEDGTIKQQGEGRGRPQEGPKKMHRPDLSDLSEENRSDDGGSPIV